MTLDEMMCAETETEEWLDLHGSEYPELAKLMREELQKLRLDIETSLDGMESFYGHGDSVNFSGPGDLNDDSV